MRNVTKSLLCLVLIAAMLLNIPIWAFAAEGQAGGVAVNTTANQIYDNVEDALACASDGDTIRLSSNASARLVCVLDGVVLDLNGYALEASYVAGFGSIVDNSAANSGVLKVSETHFMIRNDNAQLPVKTSDGYRFFEVLKFNHADITPPVADAVKYAFQPFIEPTAHEYLRQGRDASEVSIRVRVTWTRSDGTTGMQDFIYSDQIVAKFLDSYDSVEDKYGGMFALTLYHAVNYKDLAYQVYVVSDATRVEFTVPEENAPEEPVDKFLPKETVTELESGKAYPLGELFTAIDGAQIHSDGITVGFNDLNPENSDTVTMVYDGEADDWTERTVTFTGNETIEITIQDYDFCNPAKLTVTVEESERIVVTRQVRLLPNVTTDLPEGALAASPGVVFNTSPYAYTDTTLFAGKHITKIGIPVKTVEALDENQTFTLSVVKTTSDTYQYVSQNVLKLPREALGDFTTVNKWIYVDVDLQLAEDETLAFGMPDDTVEWGYSTTNNTLYNFRSANGSWNSIIKESILFDVYATETLEFTETEHGLAAVTEGRAFPNVLTDFPESAISGGNPVEFTNPPYSYLNQALFSGSRVTKIGVPVQEVLTQEKDPCFTLSVIKTGSGAYQYVNQYSLTLPAEQFAESTTVNKWVYWDVDITLAEDETLAFGGKEDTISWAWKRGFANDAYKFRDANGGITKGIFFDIHTESVLTYEEYQKQQKEEQDRLEAEQEQARQDALLKAQLSGKGISILGDSISTFQGWSNNTDYNSTIGGNAVYYTGSKDGFAAVNETWWMQTITRAGLDLVVNNSWSGDEVTNRGVSRAEQLHNTAGRNPEIIAVYLGINDFRRGQTVADFQTKYEDMVSNMLRTYPGSDVYLFTLLYTTNMESSYYKPAEVVQYNNVITDIAARYGCTLVDIYNDTGITPENLATYMGDGTLHPNYAGMDLITQCFMDALRENYISNSVQTIAYLGEAQYDIAAEGQEPELQMKVTYLDGREETVTITEDMYVVDDPYVKPDFQTEGNYAVKVAYKNGSTTFDLKILDPNILIRNEEFIYGSYFDHDRFEGNTGTRITSAAYGLIRSADALLPAQDITIQVKDTDLTDYKVTLGYYTKDGVYTGRNGILPMTDGQLTIKASEMRGTYFRVNVYLYNGSFTKVPASAQIVVYKEAPAQPDPTDPTVPPASSEPTVPPASSEPTVPPTTTEPAGPTTPTDPSEPPETTVPQVNPWEGKKISIVGDSISTGGYPGILANLSGATIQNVSVSGKRLAGGLTGLVPKVEEDADLVIIFGGTNDYWHKATQIGAADSTDSSTYVGALRYILNYLKTNYPNAKYLFVFPPDQTFGGNSCTTDFGYGTLGDFRAAFLNFCQTNNVPYVNLADTEFNSAKHSGDGVHPNSAGHQIIAEAIYRKISQADFFPATITNVLNLNELTPGYIAANGTLGTTATLSYTKRIPVTSTDTFTMWHFGTAATNTEFRFVTAYDENDRVVPSAGADTVKSYTVPAGITSVVFTISTDSAEESMILKNASVAPERYIAFNDNTKTLEIPMGEHLTNLFNPEAVSDGYMAPDGGVSSASTLCHTERLSVAAGDVLYVWNGTTQYTPRFVTAFDAAGNAVAACGSNSPAAVYTVPEGIAEVVFTLYTSAKDTVMIFKNDDTVPPTYIPYNEETEDKEEDESGSVQYGSEYLTAFGDMGTSTTLSAGRADIITAKHLTFDAEVTSFEGLRLGHGYQDYTASYIEIDNTAVRQYFYNNSPILYTEVPHGLEIENDIKVTIDVNNRRVATVTITSNTQTFTFSTSTNWYGSIGEIYATSLGSELPNAQLLFTCDGYASDIQFYGDSYLSQSSDRWLYYAFNDGHTDALFDGYGGRGSGGAYASLVENLKHSNPSVVVWLMGMNDGSDADINTPSNTWATYTDKLIALSEEEGFEIVFATIPTVPNINHEGKNQWIRESGYRYIDIAAAVGADGTGAWTQGMLSTDNVHPTASGSTAIYQQVLKDLPEF